MKKTNAMQFETLFADVPEYFIQKLNLNSGNALLTMGCVTTALNE